jgi:hypothetical protein
MCQGRYQTERSWKTLGFLKEKYVEEKDNVSKMQQLYGDDWSQQLNQEYEAITQEYFGNRDNFKTFVNPPLRRLIAAIGFRFSPFAKPWQERTSFSSQGVICSEFAVIGSLECIKRLNEKIATKWKEDGKSGPAPEVFPPVRPERRLTRVLPHEILERGKRTATVVEDPIPNVMLKVVSFHQYRI